MLAHQGVVKYLILYFTTPWFAGARRVDNYVVDLVLAQGTENVATNIAFNHFGIAKGRRRPFAACFHRRKKNATVLRGLKLGDYNVLLFLDGDSLERKNAPWQCRIVFGATSRIWR